MIPWRVKDEVMVEVSSLTTLHILSLTFCSRHYFHACLYDRLLWYKQVYIYQRFCAVVHTEIILPVIIPLMSRWLLKFLLSPYFFGFSGVRYSCSLQLRNVLGFLVSIYESSMIVIFSCFIPFLPAASTCSKNAGIVIYCK